MSLGSVTVLVSLSSQLLEQKKSEASTEAKAKIWFPHAQAVQSQTAELYNYIQGLKDQILKEAGADYVKGDSSYKDDNLDIATRIMVEKGAGKELLSKLTKYKSSVLAVSPEINKEFANSLPIITMD